MRGYAAAVVAVVLTCGIALAQERQMPPMGGGMPGPQMQMQGMPQQMGPGCDMQKGCPMGMKGGMRDEMRGGKRDGGDGMECKVEKLLDNKDLLKEIGVSEEKAAEIKAKLLSFEKEQIELEAKLKLAELDQRELMKAEKPDEKAIMKAIEKTGELRIEAMKLRVSRMLALKGAVTADQVKKVREIMGKKMRENKQQGQQSVVRPNAQRGMNKQGQMGPPPEAGNAPQPPQAPAGR